MFVPVVDVMADRPVLRAAKSRNGLLSAEAASAPPYHRQSWWCAPELLARAHVAVEPGPRP